MLNSNYILILFWCGLMGIVALFVPQVYRSEKLIQEKVKRISPIFAVIAVFPLVIWTGNRGNVGDTYAYIDSFRKMPTSFAAIGEYLNIPYFCTQ